MVKTYGLLDEANVHTVPKKVNTRIILLLISVTFLGLAWISISTGEQGNSHVSRAPPICFAQVIRRASF